MYFTIYNETTGEIIRAGECAPSDFSVQSIPPGHAILAAQSIPSETYVENGQVFWIPAAPNSWSVYDYVAKQWVPHTGIADTQAREKRTKLLAESDWTDTASAPGRLGTELYEAWQTYRQALRDVPQQPGYPLTINWPSAPV